MTEPNGKKDEALSELIGRQVVLDTAGTTVILGRLVRLTSDCFVLEDADLHDCREGHSGKELYVLNAAKYDVKSNRRRLYVLREVVIAISDLADVVTD